MAYSCFFAFLSQYAKNEDIVLADSSIMGQLPLIALFSSFLFWTNFYFFLCIFNRHHTPEWNCRIVTGVHGTVATFLTFMSAFVIGPWPFSYIAQPNIQLHITIIIISEGYFIFDFMWCIWYMTEGPVLLAHHLVSLFGFTYVLHSGMYGSELSAVLGGSEASNPFLQTRWFMKESNLYHGFAEKLIDYAFVAVFLGVRLGIGTALHIRVQTDPAVDWIPKIGGQAFYIISVIFGVQIVIFFTQKYILKKSKKPKQ